MSEATSPSPARNRPEGACHGRCSRKDYHNPAQEHAQSRQGNRARYKADRPGNRVSWILPSLFSISRIHSASRFPTTQMRKLLILQRSVPLSIGSRLFWRTRRHQARLPDRRATGGIEYGIERQGTPRRGHGNGRRDMHRRERREILERHESGTHGIGSIESFPLQDLYIKIGGEVRDFDPRSVARARPSFCPIAFRNMPAPPPPRPSSSRALKRPSRMASAPPRSSARERAAYHPRKSLRRYFRP